MLGSEQATETREYPEHEKLLAVKDESQAIGEFLDGCRFTLCEPDPHREGVYRATHLTIQAILADWFGIDQEKLEAEKRAMLDALLENVRDGNMQAQAKADGEFEMTAKGTAAAENLIHGDAEAASLWAELESNRGPKGGSF